MPSIQVKNNSRMEIAITDWRFLAKELRKVEPRVMSRFKREAKQIGKPVENAIRKAIPNKIDIRGMQPKVIPGRMSWGGDGTSPKKTTMVINTRSYKRKGTSIVSIWAWSPALSMLDLARKIGKANGGDTREYPYSKSPTGLRRHRINGQGRGLLKAAAKSTKLLRADRPSRVVWPAAWKAIPEVNAEMNKFIESEARKINAVMRRK